MIKILVDLDNIYNILENGDQVLTCDANVEVSSIFVSDETD